MRSVIKVLLKKDMSLIKRIHQWLLGPIADFEQQREYFYKYSKYIILSAIKVSPKAFLNN